MIYRQSSLFGVGIHYKDLILWWKDSAITMPRWMDVRIHPIYPKRIETE